MILVLLFSFAPSGLGLDVVINSLLPSKRLLTIALTGLNGI